MTTTHLCRECGTRYAPSAVDRRCRDCRAKAIAQLETTLSESLPAAASCGDCGDISPVSSSAEQDAPRAGGDANPPANLLDRWHDALARARTAETALGRRWLVEEMQNIDELLVDTNRVCQCGYPFDELTGHCEQCLERAEQLSTAREHAGLTALAIDEAIGF